ncbi:MAG: NAD(P)/FAD-dependent oxidoreductase [Candidatus Scalindua sp.]
MKRIIVVGGGFAGLNAAKILGNSKGCKVTLIDRRNHHLFQPLLYQVAMAALSPAEIAAPIRNILSGYKIINVIQDEVKEIKPESHYINTDHNEYDYDYLILACGSHHSYFGNEGWEKYAPGLKTIEQATEIRRRVLTAFEEAEREESFNQQIKYLTFVIVGGGPTGVELAGAIGEMSRYTLTKDFRRIDPTLTRIILLEGGNRILPSFSSKLSVLATRYLEKLGVLVWTSRLVTSIDSEGVYVGDEQILSATVLWAAGIQASGIGKKLGVDRDSQGRVIVEPDLSLRKYPDIFVVGDQAHFSHQTDKPLPGLAPVAVQQGRFVAKNIIRELGGQTRHVFKYMNKGQMATIGRSKAIVECGSLEFGGFTAWVTWLLVHIYFLAGFKNRTIVVLNWAWSYLTFHRGARLIINKEWRFFHDTEELKKDKV